MGWLRCNGVCAAQAELELLKGESRWLAAVANARQQQQQQGLLDGFKLCSWLLPVKALLELLKCEGLAEHSTHFTSRCTHA
jgi:hypothetical protein